MHNSQLIKSTSFISSYMFRFDPIQSHLQDSLQTSLKMALYNFIILHYMY
jgi:hypothetical protein